MKILKQTLLLLVSVLFGACSQQEQISYLPLSYAEGLRWCEGEGWIGVEVLDAWNKGRVLQRYILVPRDAKLPDPLPEGTLIRTPLQRAVAFSSVHGGLFCDLHCADQLVGMCDVDYILQDSLLQRLADGRLANLGSSMSVDAERIVGAHPDALFVSPFENAGYGILSTLNVPLVECADYMETSALGRAEWMKFYGRLMGCDTLADSLFAEVEKSYLQLKALADSASAQPTMMCDLKQGSAWYVPGADSYLGRLFSDAGCHYLFDNNKESGSVPLSFETVFAQGHQADVWIVKYGSAVPYSYERLKADNPLYANFRAWKERRIYACNTFKVPFYEEIPFHPDRLLRDMVRIFHPELLPGHQLKYYIPLPE